MPIEVEQIKPDMYALRWIGNVKMKEIRESHEETLRLATEAGIEQYIHILELSKMISFPYDLAGLWSVIINYPQAFAIMIVNAPLAGKTMAALINRISKRVSLETFDTFEQAQERAEKILVEKRIRQTASESKPISS